MEGGTVGSDTALHLVGLLLGCRRPEKVLVKN